MKISRFSIIEQCFLKSFLILSILFFLIGCGGGGGGGGSSDEDQDNISALEKDVKQKAQEIFPTEELKILDEALNKVASDSNYEQYLTNFNQSLNALTNAFQKQIDVQQDMKLSLVSSKSDVFSTIQVYYDSVKNLFSNIYGNLSSDTAKKAFLNTGMGWSKGVLGGAGGELSIASGVGVNFTISGGTGIATTYDFLNLSKYDHSVAYCTKGGGITIGGGGGLSGTLESIYYENWIFGLKHNEIFEGGPSIGNDISIGLVGKVAAGIGISGSIGSWQGLDDSCEVLSCLYSDAVANNLYGYSYAVKLEGSLGTSVEASANLNYSNAYYCESLPYITTDFNESDGSQLERLTNACYMAVDMLSLPTGSSTASYAAAIAILYAFIYDDALIGEIEVDNDGDGYSTAEGDCADNNKDINPDAIEDCDDGIDNDCDQLTDCDDIEDCYYSPLCGPGLIVSPKQLDFGSEHTELTFQIQNGGGSVLNWSLSENRTWLGCSSDSGNTGGDGEYTGSGDELVTVTVGRIGLASGTYTGQIFISSTNSGNKTIQVEITVPKACDDKDSDGYYNNSDCGTEVDCDDNNPDIKPGATEICGDGIDQDCDDNDLSCDPGPKDTDDDGDNFTENKGDCNDSDKYTHPDAIEICDGKDNDCDGQIDEGDVCQTCTDSDNDGYYKESGCGTQVDCNDDDSSIHPGATENCNLKDDDCDGIVDEGVKNIYYRDKDNDNYGNANDTLTSCSRPSGYVSDNNDCNDNDPSIHLGATEVCDSKDNDCDGSVDEGGVCQTCTDADGDGYYVTSDCGTLEDCNDSDPNIYPDAVEICGDGIDQDCNGNDLICTEIVYFPDSNLEVAVREAISKPTGDILTSDLDGLTYLRAYNNGIQNLEGLQYCTSLTNLDLEFNEIIDISALGNLTNIINLLLRYNQINDIDSLKNLTKLEYITLDANQISDISALANLKNLTNLGLSSNQISNISTIGNLTKITGLGLAINQISDISALTNLQNLAIFHAEFNQISDISSLANLTNLESLRLLSNQISDISALISNNGIGNGDWVNLESNPLDTASCTQYIPELESRGVDVNHDCP